MSVEASMSRRWIAAPIVAQAPVSGGSPRPPLTYSSDQLSTGKPAH
jgi:hypothetical protein